MATTTPARPDASAQGGRRRPGGPLRWIKAHIIPLAAGGALIYMFLPIIVVVVFSFNQPNGRYNDKLSLIHI